MLVELRIRDIAVINAVALPLAPALNVLTGETGAGKSLIVGALGLLLGDRAAGDRLRAGAERGSVEGIFELGARDGVRSAIWELLDSRGLDADGGVVVLKRELSASGRSRAWVNGTPVTVAVLSEIGGQLVSVHGQHEAQYLLQSDTQRDVLDQFADARGDAAGVAALHTRLVDLQSQANDRATRVRDAERRADYLRFVVAEIAAAQPVPGEDERIEAEVRLLSHAQDIRTLSLHASSALDGDDDAVLGRLRSVRRTLVSLLRFDPRAEGWIAALDEGTYALDELAREVAAAGDDVESNPARLRTLEARRETLHQLSRKYGPGLESVLETLRSAEAELELVDCGAQERAAIAANIARTDTELRAAAATLTSRRQAGARKLERAVTALLPELGMVDGAFKVALEALPAVNAHGAEHVSFQVVLNAGGELRPLARIASGGELARIMLALSTVLARLQEVPTLVFDEVDAGVGGTVAWQVGALMRRVASHHQVLAISHLAQIAARAHHHVVVSKADVGGVTSSDTRVVVDEARVVEIARMLGGDADREVSRAHARELLVRGARDAADLPDGDGRPELPKAPADRVSAGGNGVPQRRGKRV